MTWDNEMDHGEEREHPPISELDAFALPPDPGFVARVERAIHRREAGAAMVELSLSGFFLLLQEFLRIALAFDMADPEIQEEEE